MPAKSLPISAAKIQVIAQEFGTPFHLYLEEPIRANAQKLLQAFAWAPSFKEYFAVKALPNPHILELLREEGFGADCSSLAELMLAEAVGLKGEEICFSSNNTPAIEYQKALELGAILNLDDITHIDFLAQTAYLPELLSFRYNPGPLRGGGNQIIGYPEEAKYGLTAPQILEALNICRQKGVKRFALHTMVVSNELNLDYLLGTARMMFELAVKVKEQTGITIEFVNLGGGLGIPYHPDEKPIDLAALGEGIHQQYQAILGPAGLDKLGIRLESGRLITGPYGYLVAEAIHEKRTYKHYIGLDACMVDLMRPALYGAYHHISVVGKESAPYDHTYDITGSLCENNDKFAIDRQLPQITIGDLVVLHDTGAHGQAMGFNYNGKLRSQELLLRPDGSVKKIRRAETVADLFATLDYPGLHFALRSEL